jgi:hypothetical protein
MTVRLWTLLLITLCAIGCSDNARHEQLFVGYNGPSLPITEYFENADSVKSSWVARAVTPTELERVLSRIAFEHEILVVAAVGLRETATNVALDGISVWESNAITTYIRVGVIEADCSQPRSKSYPFVLAVVERPKKFNGSGGYHHQNYPDGCKAVARGSPNEKSF